MMFGVLALAFLVVPFVELFVLIQVGQAIGALNTIVILILVSVVGAALVKRQGMSVVRRAQARVAAGEVPGREIVDGILVILAGALLLTPGFVTDIAGVALLLPGVRDVVRAALTRFLARRAQVRVFRQW